jgi:hypothetical protein
MGASLRAFADAFPRAARTGGEVAMSRILRIGNTVEIALGIATLAGVLYGVVEVILRLLAL